MRYLYHGLDIMVKQSNSNIYPNTSTTIGTHTTNTFILRAVMQDYDDDDDNDNLLFNDLSIIGIYQIRHTYPTHIVTV